MTTQPRGQARPHPSTPRLRNHPAGYGLVTKTLHWVTVLALAGQFAALAVHVGMVLKHQLIDRDRLLNRML